MAFPPDVYLIGAMKAGTTSLAYMLDQHPGVLVADPKEPDFFTAHQDRGLAWYEGCFPDRAGRLCIDASTSYTFAPVAGAVYSEANRQRLGGVPERIARLRPDARFIYILREPVARTYSAYNHNVRAGWERRTFAEALRCDPEYLCASHYAAQLGRYYDCFPRESVLVLLFEDFKRDPHGVARRCFEFLGLDPEHPVALERAVNAGYRYTALGEGLRRTGIIGLLSGIVPDSLKQRLAGLVSRPIPPMTAEDKAWLRAYFAPLNEELARETGLDLSAWAAGGGRTG